MISTSSSALLVVVVGATGNQGGSVITSLLESSKPYRIRGLTRDVSKAKAVALTGKGVEMMEVDVSQTEDVRVKKAFEDADIAFVMTDFWSHRDKSREIAEGKNLLTILSTIHTIKLIIWSGLENVASVSKGSYLNVDHFDGKAEVTEFGRSLFPLSSPVKFVNVQPGYFASNFLGSMGPRKVGDEVYAMMAPMSPETKIPVIDIEGDYGVWVRGVIEAGEDFYGAAKEVRTGEMIAMGDLAQTVAKVTGKNVIYKQITDEAFIAGAASNKVPEKIAIELLEMMKFYQDFGYYGSKEASSPDKLSRKPKNWEEFVTATKSKWEEMLY